MCVALVAWRERPPRPRPADAPATEFSADRAWPVLSYLADTLGVRVAGTPSAERALAYLESRLRALPGFEVEVQDVTGHVRVGPTRVNAYRTRNLVARRAGRVADAVLVSVHYDSPSSSVGAADDALAVAAVIEMMRALAAAADTMRNTLVININGAEEQGLLGAHGFLSHRWMRDVRIAVDLESAGPGGKAILFQTGPGEGWLARAYARGAPHPYGTVLGQDIFQSGAIPSATDFEVYRDAGIPGIDIALYRDGYAYHTKLDRTNRIDPGSLQHMGANALGLVRELGSANLSRPRSSERAVYYDLLGFGMITYGERTAVVLAIVAIVLAIAALAIAVRFGAASVGDVVWGGLATTIGCVLAIAATPVFALTPWWIAGKLHGWYAHPWRGYLAYAAFATAVLLGVLWLTDLRRSMRDGSAARRASGGLAGALAGIVVLFAALTVIGAGSAYLLLWATFGGTVALLALTRTPTKARLPLAAAALLPAVLLSLQAASLTAEFATIGGRMRLGVPYDAVLAGIAALVVVVVLTLPFGLVASAGGRGRAALVSLGVGIAALAWTAASFPYTKERPQRLVLVHADTVLTLQGFDFPGARFTWSRIAQGGERKLAPDSMPAALAPGDAPRTEVRRVRDSGDTREVELRVFADGATTVSVQLPEGSVVGWPYGDPPGRSGRAVVRIVAPPDTGWVVPLRLGKEPVVATVVTSRPSDSPEAARIRGRLPAWTDVYTIIQRRARITL